MKKYDYTAAYEVIGSPAYLGNITSGESDDNFSSLVDGVQSALAYAHAHGDKVTFYAYWGKANYHVGYLHESGGYYLAPGDTVVSSSVGKSISTLETIGKIDKNEPNYTDNRYYVSSDKYLSVHGFYMNLGFGNGSYGCDFLNNFLNNYVQFGANDSFHIIPPGYEEENLSAPFVSVGIEIEGHHKLPHKVDLPGSEYFFFDPEKLIGQTQFSGNVLDNPFAANKV